MTSSYQKIFGFDRPHVSEMLSDSKISTLESGFKNFRICLRIRRMRVDDSRIRKEKVADTCGRGLNQSLKFLFSVFEWLPDHEDTFLSDYIFIAASKLL